jgi:hypothetical protein
MGRTIAVAGALAQRPSIGGHTWVFLQYLLGFKRLGWDVLFLDQIAPDLCVDSQGSMVNPEGSTNARYLVDVMDAFGLSQSFALMIEGQKDTVGLSRQAVTSRLRDAAFLLNVNGYLRDEDLLAAVPMRVYLDIDPGFTHMWQDLGLSSVFTGHDAYVTIGENLGKPFCPIPTCGIDWITTPQPVVLDQWPAVAPPASVAFSSIATWRGAFAPLEYQGKTYGLRVHEFRKFADLPARTGEPFSLALDIHPSEVRDLQLLRDGGWMLLDPRSIAGTPCRYRQFIQESGAEFMVSKTMYVETHSGWISDRSLCYLASGRPVLMQDTGIGELYPVGEGLLTFSDALEAAAGVEALARDYHMHAGRARELAETYFDSDRVLGRLLSRLGCE